MHEIKVELGGARWLSAAATARSSPEPKSSSSAGLEPQVVNLPNHLALSYQENH